MPVPIYGPSAWREFRGTPSHASRNTSVHLAKIADPTGKLHDCYVKLLPANFGPALLCEGIGWLLAHASGVSAVPFAAIALVPIDELRKHLLLPDTINETGVCPAWCAEIVPGGQSVKQLHSWTFAAALQDCLRSREVPSVAALDIWADNRDRNYGNVVKAGSGAYIAIDHESVLDEALWQPFGKTFTPNSLFAEAKKRLGKKQLDTFEARMVKAAERHSIGLKSVSADIIKLVSDLYPAAADDLCRRILSYLEPRASDGWLATAIGVLPV